MKTGLQKAWPGIWFYCPRQEMSTHCAGIRHKSQVHCAPVILALGSTPSPLDGPPSIYVGHFLHQWLMWEGLAHHGWCHSWVGDSKQATESQPVCSTPAQPLLRFAPPDFCLSSCPGFPCWLAGTYKPHKSSPPRNCFWSVFYQSNREAK